MNKILSIIKNNKYLKDYITEDIIRQFTRYFIVGITSFTIEYSLFFILYHLYKLHYIIASSSVYLIVFWVNFFLNRLWSFKSDKPLGKQIFKYLLLFIFNLIVPNIFLMYLFTDVIGINALISKVLIMGAVVSWNFILYKKFIY